MDIFLVYLVFISAVCAVELGDSGGLHFETNGEYAATYDNYKPRDYQFEYGVSDPHTGDHKSHWEVRENGVVKGSYSLLEPDGTTRVVDYVADKHGFRAVVKKLGTAIHSVHVDTPLEPIIVEDTDHSIELTEPAYKSYDGYVDNYHGVFDGEPKDAPTLLEGINSDDYTHILSSNLELLQPLDVKIPPPSLLLDAEIGDLKSPLIGKYNQEQIIPLGSPEAGVIQEHRNPIHGEYQDYKIEQILPISLPKAEGIQIQKWNNNYGSANLLGGSYQEHYTPQKSSSKIVHPHGISSSHYHGVTGNPEDDSRYINYGNGWKIEVGDVGDYSQAESVVLPHNHKFSPKIEPLPYHFVINHPVLH